MNQRRPLVHDGLLHLLDIGATPPIQIGSPHWYDWLEQHTSFRYEGESIAFTVRKEKRTCGWYWYAQRYPQGKSQTIYLGKSEDLTAERLDSVAERFQHRDPPALPGPVQLPARASLSAEQRLSRIEPERLPQLAPPLPLPAPLTSLVDRVEEAGAVAGILRRADVRLVSLVGPGGVGKTRIALKLAADLRQGFADGVYFVSLEPLRDAHLVLAHIARAVGLRVDGHRSVADLLKASLQQKQLLLVLDNFEQVTAAATLLMDLLGSCPELKILVTSREVLHLNGEHPFVVSPLPFPDPAVPLSLTTFRSYPAIELFLERAQAVVPGMPLDAQSILAIAEICARLEGLPLAIELAATRVKFLPLHVLLERLGQRLAILTQGGPDRPPRQQTLRATFDWSYDLLGPDEQLIFRRLAVFSGGCDLEAAESVCMAPCDIATPFLEVISSLIDKSLLQSVPSTTLTARFHLSETVREYGLGSLALSGERASIEEAHASYYLSFALRAEPEFDSNDQERWLECLDQDDRNLTAALTFLLSGHDRERALRLTGALGWYWYVRGRLSEGLSWIEQALGYHTSSTAPVQARKALYSAGLFAIHLDEGERAISWLEQSQELCVLAGDTAGYASASHLLTLFFLLKGNSAAAQEQVERTAAFVDKSADARALAFTHCLSGVLAGYLGEFTRARTFFEWGAALFKEVDDTYMGDLALLMAADALGAAGDKAQAQALLEEQIHKLELRRAAWPAGYLLCACSRFALRREDWSRARLLVEQSLALFRRLRDPRGIARACLVLAQTALYQQDYSTAIATARQCLENARAADAVATIIGCLEELADVAVQRNKAGWAAQLWGAAARQREAAGPERTPAEPAERAQLVRHAREILGTEAFSEAWNEGRSLSLDQLLSVENVTKSVVNHPVLPSRRPAGLTRRELEVLLLVAEGLSNAEIADRLVISQGTVVSYLNIVYRKLDVSSRTAAMRYAIDHQLSESGVG